MVYDINRWSFRRDECGSWTKLGQLACDGVGRVLPDTQSDAVAVCHARFKKAGNDVSEQRTIENGRIRSPFPTNG